MVEPARYAIGMTQREYQSKLGTQYCSTGLFKSNLSRSRTQQTAEILDDDELLALSNSDIYWDKTAEITVQEPEPVYDIEVPDHHNFIANDIVVHNSLEQDADIVMFIHRPEVYEQDTLKKNIAQIKVAKHRNGPVGTIELVFRGHIAKFENAVTQNVDLTQIG